MTVIVNTGTTLTVTNATSLTIAGSDTIAAGGVVNGEGSIVGAGSLLNLGTITSDQTAGVLTVNSATLTNQGTVFANNASLAIQSGVDLTNLVSGTLTGGGWESSGTGTLAFLERSIVTDAATIILNGTGTLQADTGASLVLTAFGGAYQETVVNNGTIDVAFGGLGSGTLAMTGPYSGTGGFLLQGGFDSADRTILELPSTVSGNVAFDLNFGELLIDSPVSFNGFLSAFGNNDTIVLQGISNAASATLSGNTLTLTDGVGTTLDTISFLANTEDYSGAVCNVVENPGSTAAIVTVSGAQAA